MELPASEEGANYSKFEQKVMDFDKIPDHADLFKGFDVGFYALGVSTTSVSEEVYKKIELDNALALAKQLKDGGVKDLHWVTGQGTNKNSWFLFAKVKGQVEETVAQTGLRRVAFYRPAGVMPSEGLAGMKKFLKTVDFAHVLTVDSDLLGKAMVANSLKESDKPLEILENGPINKMGQQPCK